MPSSINSTNFLCRLFSKNSIPILNIFNTIGKLEGGYTFEIVICRFSFVKESK